MNTSVVVAWVVTLAPATALASNTSKPVAPVSFLSDPCMVTVDATVAPNHTFEIGIPFEDVGTSVDEAPGSRRMQFFATCRDRRPRETMPTWISRADAVAAAAVDPTVSSPPAEDVLGESPAWNGPGHGGAGTPCVIPINAATDRMAITCEATAEGITWDTTGVPPGAYVIWGYTYEGARSVWRRRPGVVQVTDTDASSPPAVAFSSPGAQGEMSEGAGLLLQGCASAREGVTLTLSWATHGALAEDPDAAWTPIAQLDDAGAESFEVPFVPPTDAVYEAIVFRAELDDGSGAGFATYSADHVTVLPGCDAPGGGVAAAADACGVAEPPVAVTPTPAKACDATDDDADAGDDASTDEPAEPDTGEDDGGETSEGGPTDAACDDCEVASGCAVSARDTSVPSVALWAWIAVALPWRRRRAVFHARRGDAR